MTITVMKMETRRNSRLIESDRFPFEFVSRLAERESWRKEVHRPIYHIHKWWANRLGSVFRAILLSCVLPADEDLTGAFYGKHSFSGISVFDPFMGSGTTVGEAHKLGLTAFGRDINPVAVESVKAALGPLNQKGLQIALTELGENVGHKIRNLYRSRDSHGNDCDVLYYFWVMQVDCPVCHSKVDLFPSWIVARNAYPKQKPTVQVLCPRCGDIFQGLYGQPSIECKSCGHGFAPESGAVNGPKAICPHCNNTFSVIKAIAQTGNRPTFRLYGKLILTQEGTKEYLRAATKDEAEYAKCSEVLRHETDENKILLPSLALEDGYNTRQAVNYGFRKWNDFFNDRQLVALGWLQSAIRKIEDESTRNTLLVLFSGLLEFNNMFVSYKGEGTGAVRHMFSHHILKPERTPIEANIWGTPKSSGSFSNLVCGRLLKAIEYRLRPTEINGSTRGKNPICSLPFSGKIEPDWPSNGSSANRGIYLSEGDSAVSGLPDCGVDLVVTDPPFFDNVHYSELADFFFAWQQLGLNGGLPRTTRHPDEVQDSDARDFSKKLRNVFAECRRVLKDDGLLVFTYHHSRDDGWRALSHAILGAGFIVVNSHPVKSEMSVAAPKAQAKEPIQLDIIIVCRKADNFENSHRVAPERALEIARDKIRRLQDAALTLSSNDRKIVYFGQLLSTLTSPDDVELIVQSVKEELDRPATPPQFQREAHSGAGQRLAFSDNEGGLC